MPRALSRARFRAGNSIDARMAMIAITIKSSINVKLQVLPPDDLKSIFIAVPFLLCAS